MIRILAALLTVLFVSAPSLAIAEEELDAYGVSEDVYMQTAEEYRGKASILEGEVRKIGYRLQWVVTELIDVYYDLSETRIELASAIGDRDREEQLVLMFFTLKAEEERLWQEIERSNR